MQRLAVILLALAAAVASVAVAAVPAGAASSDKRIAKTGVIVAKDLPSSWDSAPANDGSDEELEALASKFPECADYLASRALLKKAAHAESRQFTSPDGEDLSNETWVFAKTSAAKRAFAAVGASTNADCLTLMFQDAFQQQIAADPASAGQVVNVRTQIQPTRSVPSSGDDQLGYIGTVQFDLADGSAQRLLLGYFAVRTSRGILGYTVTAPVVGDGFSDSYAKNTEQAIADTAERMEKALG